jgi:hypothetical protein
MALLEADPITQEVRARAIQATERLAPMSEIAIEQLKNSLYARALDQLAELKEQIDHTRTVISILRDWQAENEKQAARLGGTNDKTSQKNS